MLGGDSLPRSESSGFFSRKDDELNELTQGFAGFWRRLDKETIKRWIKNFRPRDWNLALKLLRNVDYYTQDRVIDEFRLLHEQVKRVVGTELQNTLFCGYPGAAKSGDEMARKYRMGGGMAHPRWNSKFDYVAALAGKSITNDYKIVLIDDFIGSGHTITSSWDNVRASIPGEPDIYIAVLVSSNEGRDKVANDTDISVISNKTLVDADLTTSPRCSVFTDAEKETLRGYCRVANRYEGEYSGLGCRVVFYHRAPNNSLPVLWGRNSGWRPLFPRYQ